MTRSKLLKSLSLLALAGFSAVASAQRGGLQPGQWEMTTTLNAANIPGARMVHNRSRTVRHCLTPQAAADGGRSLIVSSGCTVKRFSFANGKIDAAMSCGPAGQAMVTETTGRYTPTAVHTISHSHSRGPVNMTVEIQARGHWIGACTAAR